MSESSSGVLWLLPGGAGLLLSSRLVGLVSKGTAPGWKAGKVCCMLLPPSMEVGAVYPVDGAPVLALPLECRVEAVR